MEWVVAMIMSFYLVGILLGLGLIVLAFIGVFNDDD
jgi:hypothetical protein